VTRIGYGFVSRITGAFAPVIACTRLSKASSRVPRDLSPELSSETLRLRGSHRLRAWERFRRATSLRQPGNHTRLSADKALGFAPRPFDRFAFFEDAEAQQAFTACDLGDVPANILKRAGTAASALPQPEGRVHLQLGFAPAGGLTACALET
jgi:hypothetical protein